MDLKGNQITVAELIANPRVMEYLRRNYRQITPEMLDAAKTLTLEQLLGFARIYLPRRKIDQLLNDLAAL